MTYDSTPISSEHFERLGPVVLIGHRGSGKSTLGPLVSALLQRPFFDLDDEIRLRSGLTFAADRHQFRRAEQIILADLCDTSPAPIIACGAGVHPVDERAFVVWLDRQNWRDAVADSNRPRVRPDLSESEEWHWMEQTRPPRWRRAAHLRLPIPRGRTPQRSARDLATLLRWAATSAGSPLTQKTWLVPTSCDDLLRAQRDVRRLGFAGVELRSDVFDGRPADADTTGFIASLRHPDATWLADFSDACAWDVDVHYVSKLDADLAATVPERVILSSHPAQICSETVQQLLDARRALCKTLEMPEERVELKLAPSIRGFDELDTLLELLPRLRNLAPNSTALPTSRDFAWMRPILAADNATNYLPVGLRSRTPDHPTPTDFNEFLPHLAGPPPTHFDALVGHPVHQSQGALWHRRRSMGAPNPSPLGGKWPKAQSSRRSMGAHSYLLIPVAQAMLDRSLQTLENLPIRGLSVTSPLKREAAQCPRVDAPQDLSALNTLRRAPGNAERPWTGTDTDVRGMSECLEFFESHDIGPGRAVVFGRGGASHAILRALEDRRWELTAHISAREGWQPHHLDLEPVDLIVHAAGPHIKRNEFTPKCRAWLDLHYTDVAEPPPETLHLQGDLFFEAQAEAQRRFWE